MKSFKSSDYQFKYQNLNTGYKIYSSNKDHPFDGMQGIVIENCFNEIIGNTDKVFNFQEKN